MVVLTFYFDLVPPLYFLKCNRYFLIFVPNLKSLIYLLITVGGMYQVTVSKLSTNRILINSLDIGGFTVLK